MVLLAQPSDCWLQTGHATPSTAARPRQQTLTLLCRGLPLPQPVCSRPPWPTPAPVGSYSASAWPAPPLSPPRFAAPNRQRAWPREVLGTGWGEAGAPSPAGAAPGTFQPKTRLGLLEELDGAEELCGCPGLVGPTAVRPGPGETLPSCRSPRAGPAASPASDSSPQPLSPFFPSHYPGTPVLWEGHPGWAMGRGATRGSHLGGGERKGQPVPRALVLRLELACGVWRECTLARLPGLL